MRCVPLQYFAVTHLTPDHQVDKGRRDGRKPSSRPYVAPMNLRQNLTCYSECAKRWHHSLDPNVKRGPWTTEEDRSLIEAVQRVGRDWKEIGRELFPSRSTTDIKNR